MPDRYDIIEVADHDCIVAVMNETVKGKYPPSYEQYALAYDPTLDFITQIKSWQSAEKLDAINRMLTEGAEEFDLANGIVMYSARVDILQRLIRALLTTAYAHLPDKRNSADVDDGKAIFHAFPCPSPRTGCFIRTARSGRSGFSTSTSKQPLLRPFFGS